MLIGLTVFFCSECVVVHAPGPVVQTLDSAIQWRNATKTCRIFQWIVYTPFKQLGPDKLPLDLYNQYE